MPLKMEVGDTSESAYWRFYLDVTGKAKNYAVRPEVRRVIYETLTLYVGLLESQNIGCFAEN